MYSINPLLLFTLFLALTTVQAGQQDSQNSMLEYICHPVNDATKIRRISLEASDHDTKSFMPAFDDSSSRRGRVPPLITDESEERLHNIMGTGEASRSRPPIKKPKDQTAKLESSRIVEASSKDHYCFLLPESGSFANKTDTVQSYCSHDSVLTTTSCKELPPNLMSYVDHWEDTKRGYVEVRAVLNLEARRLNPEDQGVMYTSDNLLGFKSYNKEFPYAAQFLEPNMRLACLRLCKIKKDCHFDTASDGCLSGFGDLQHDSLKDFKEKLKEAGADV